MHLLVCFGFLRHNRWVRLCVPFRVYLLCTVLRHFVVTIRLEPIHVHYRSANTFLI